jgi:hypothetical protein
MRDHVEMGDYSESENVFEQNMSAEPGLFVAI